jgi:hypothetical protein
MISASTARVIVRSGIKRRFAISYDVSFSLLLTSGLSLGHPLHTYALRGFIACSRFYR